MTTEQQYSIDGESCLNALRSVPLFSALSDNLLRTLTGAVLFRKAQTGLRIIHEGQAGGELFILLSGSGRVVKGPDDVVLASLGPGDYVGEMSLIDGEPRSASVDIIEDAELMVVGKPHFEQVMASEPALMQETLRVLSMRLRTTSARIQEQESSRMH